MSQTSIQAETRDSAGKGVARKLRAKGLVPGVLYGRDATPTLFSVEEKTMIRLIKEDGINCIVELDLGGKKQSCMIAEYQTDVFQRRLIHVDLKLIDIKRPVVVKVPVNMIGVQKVRSRGGIAQLYLRELKVRVLPTEIPKGIDVDISEMNPGDSQKLNVITLPEQVESLDPSDATVVNILAPRALAVAVEEDAEGEGEGEGAAEGEGGEAKDKE